MILEHTTRTLTLREPFRISRSVTHEREAVWVRLAHRDHEGFGEVVTSVRRALDSDRIHRVLDALTPWVDGLEDPEHLRGALPELLAAHPGEEGVIDALDAAIHDLIATRIGVGVHALLDAPAWGPVATAATIGIVDPATATARAASLIARGFELLKIKVGHADPRRDVDQVAAVRAAAPDARLLVDPNGAWEPGLAVEVLTEIAPMQIEAIEQPIPPGTPAELARIAEAVGMTVVADEDAATIHDVRALPPGIGVNVKLAECGGALAARTMIGEAHAGGRDVMIGCLASSSLGIAPAAHLAGLARWVDLDGHLLLARDPWSGLGGHDGVLRPSGRPGWGVQRTPPAAASPVAPSVPETGAAGVDR